MPIVSPLLTVLNCLEQYLVLRFALLRPGEIVQSRNTIVLDDVYAQKRLVVIDFSKYKHYKGVHNCVSIIRMFGVCCPICI